MTRPTLSHARFLSFGGTLPEAQFLAALPGAAAYVDALIWPNEPDAATEDAYLDAIAAVIEFDDEPVVTSERVGQTAVTYGEVPTKRDAAARHLIGTGLLYRGI